MIKNKKYKYNITFNKGVKDNITNKLTDYKISYNTEDIFKAIDTTFSDMNILNITDKNDNPDEEKTKIRQKEIIEKEKRRLDNIESMSEQDKDKLYEENKKLMETIKKIEHAEIKEWMIDQGFKEDEITEKLIEENRDYYFNVYLYDDYTYREYNEDGTYNLVRDDRQEELDREEESGKKPSSNSGSSNVLEYDYGITIKLTEYTPITGGNISELNKIPDLFLNKRSLLILRNNDDKCFLYCYIREILNPITRNSFRITRKDKELANEIINETNLNFENVSISEIDKIEKKLKVNVNVFSCNKNYKNKTLLENLEKIIIKY